ncbi:unnamed protein product [Ectocarpus sp. 12 AP-2014]
MASAAEDFSSVDMFPGTMTVYGACRPVSSYERLNRIGEGAYGTVYRAVDKQTNSIVALKKAISTRCRTPLPGCSERTLHATRRTPHGGSPLVM